MRLGGPTRRAGPEGRAWEPSAQGAEGVEGSEREEGGREGGRTARAAGGAARRARAHGHLTAARPERVAHRRPEQEVHHPVDDRHPDVLSAVDAAAHVIVVARASVRQLTPLWGVRQPRLAASESGPRHPLRPDWHLDAQPPPAPQLEHPPREPHQHVPPERRQVHVERVPGEVPLELDACQVPEVEQGNLDYVIPVGSTKPHLPVPVPGTGARPTSGTGASRLPSLWPPGGPFSRVGLQSPLRRVQGGCALETGAGTGPSDAQATSARWAALVHVRVLLAGGGRGPEGPEVEIHDQRARVYVMFPRPPAGP